MEMEGGKTHNSKFTRPHLGLQVRRVLVHEGEVPVGGREAGKGEDEGEEDDEEDDVGAEGADEEDEADESCSVRRFC